MNVQETKSSWPGPLYGLYIASIFSVMLGNLIIRVGSEAGWLSRPIAIALAIIIVIPMIVTAVLFWRLMRTTLDEMLQRVVLEGFAFAMVIFMPILALYASLKSVNISFTKLDMPEIVMTPAVLIALGIALSWRRINK